MGGALLLTAIVAPGAVVGVLALLFALFQLAIAVNAAAPAEIGLVWARVLAIPGTIVVATVLLDRACYEAAPPAPLRRIGPVLGFAVLFSLIPAPVLLGEIFLRRASGGADLLGLLRLVGQGLTAACVGAATLQLAWALPMAAFAWIARREQLAGSALVALRALRPIAMVGLIAFTAQLMLSFLVYEVGPTNVLTRLGEG